MKNFFQKMVRSLQAFHAMVVDALFPIHCLCCQQEGVWLCDKCLSRISLIVEHACGVCEKMLTPDGRTCHNCKRRSPLDGMLVAASYRNNLVSHSVHLFKYRFAQDLHMPLGKLLVSALCKTELPLPDFIVPVPLHPRRLRWRGFNQSELLATYVSQNLIQDLEIPCAPSILKRIRFTSAQKNLKNFQQRKENISGAFVCQQQALIKGKTIMLVDDVATTGSTILECARILKKAGAREVFALVIARQDSRKNA